MFQVVPLEATLSSAPPKPPVSKFKASRTATLPSHSLGPYIIPSSQTNTLNRAIRFGKLEDGQLVGGAEGESEDELDGPAPSGEILKLLSEGGVTNIGPASGSSTEFLRPLVATESPLSSQALSPVSKGSPWSDHSTLYSPSPSDPNTPIAMTERSSPKISAPTSPDHIPPHGRALPISPLVMECPRQSVTGAIVERVSQSAPPSATGSVPINSGVIRSPGFSPASSAAKPPFQSLIIESPSFAGAPPLQSSVSESISAKPPVVMAAEVKEGSGSRIGSDHASKGSERKKVSRFLAQRG